MKIALGTERKSGLKSILMALMLPLALWSGSAWGEPYGTVVLQGLDKVTARVTTLNVDIGDVARFGTLEIIARHCDKRPPEDPPESAAFLDIWEVRLGEAAVGIFRGWMFASSPGLNALEHPVYDVWVKDCANKLSISEDNSASDGSLPVIPPGN